jgi:hypothetical protein
MKCSAVLAFFALVLFALPLAAKDAEKPAVNADDKESFATVSEWVHKEMGTGGRYEHVTPSERKTVDRRLSEMGTLFDQHGNVAQMTDSDRTRMFNNQEEVNAILSKRDGDRMICKSVAPVGSHIPVKTCKTQRELAQSRRETEQFMNDRSQITQKRGGN